MNKISKFLCAFALFALAVAMAAFLLPTQAQAATIASGACGKNLTWTLDDAGTLTISGTGAMWNYSYSSSPWESKRSSIKTVVIGNGVTSIGDYAFCNCTSLTSVTIPDSVTSIGGSAFKDCASLTSVTIGDSVTSIGEWTFDDCTSLTSVTIGDSVTSIGRFAFHNCTSLTGITIPDSVTSIGGSAFSGCTSLTSITIPDSVTSIGDSAFIGCTSLTSVTIGDSVTSIGNDAFFHCTSLTDVYITDIEAWCRISFADYDANPLYYAEKLYLNDQLVTEVEIPDSVTRIGNHAFYDYTNLKSITIPDSVTSIGDYAFYGCDSLTSVTIPDSVTSIGEYAFSYCYRLKDVYYSGTENQWAQISIGSSNYDLTSATIHYNHTHDYSLFPVTTVEPTCTAAGYREYTCIYGETYREVIPALGHSTGTDAVVTAPTCEADGYTTSTCPRCKTVVKTDAVAALGHDYSGITTVVEPKCAEEGYTLTQCTRCDSVEKQEITSSLGHKMVLVPAVPATCTEPGLTAGTACERCGLVGVAQKEVAETGHNMIGNTCTNCGLYLSGDIDGNGFVDVEDVVALLLHVTMPDMFEISGIGDMDGNGSVDVDDVVHLLLHVTMPDMFPL